MPTNKKIKTGKNSAKTQEPPPPKPMKVEKAPPFTQPQLVILILISLGISRLLTVKASAFSEQTCTQNLGEEACQNDVVRDALLYKFHTGLQTTFFIAACVLQCWREEAVLQHFNSTLVLVPLFLTGLVLSVGNEFVVRRTLMNQFVMGAVLAFLGMPPSKGQVPFWATTRRHSAKSLQSLTCVSLAAMNILEAGRWCVAGMLDDYKWTTVVAPQVLQQAVVTPAHAAVFPILALVAVDFLTKAVVHLFVWYYLGNWHQRAYLMTLAGLQLFEYFYQVPILDGVLQQSESLGMMSLSIAFFCAVGWLAPESLSWKKKVA